MRSLALIVLTTAAQAAPAVVGDAHTFTPLAVDVEGAQVVPSLFATGAATLVSGFPVDAEGTRVESDPAVDGQVRVGLLLDSGSLSSTWNLRLEGEYALVSGILTGGAIDTGEVLDPPLAEESDHHLRKAFGRFSLGPFVTVGGGYTTSHWGLGLLANDGAHPWTPGSAAFTDPRGGDRVLRALVATGPWTSNKLMIIGAYDVTQHDDVLRAGDEATQAIGAVTLGDPERRHVGLYGVYRMQEASDGQTTTVSVADLFARWSGRVGGWRYTAALEGALVVGETELGPSTEFPTHDVQQLGVATEVKVDAGQFGAVLSTFFASGDRDAADGSQNAFKADPGFQQGLLLYRHLLAGTSGRAPITAADPELIGYPSEDLDRLTTRGAVTNTFAFFPRIWGRPVAGLEIYGGPLFAWTAVEQADPRESRLTGGGTPRNTFGGGGGGYLGTELDLGVRYQLIFSGTELTAGLEAAIFTPGSALEDAEGHARGALQGGRFTLSYRL